MNTSTYAAIMIQIKREKSFFSEMVRIFSFTFPTHLSSFLSLLVLFFFFYFVLIVTPIYEKGNRGKH